MSDSASSRATRTIDRPAGAVAYQVTGEGPLIVCVPRMGDLRSSYRFSCPMLVAAGYRVALIDLRCHDDRDAGFHTDGDGATAADVAALIGELGGSGIVVGDSMAAGSAVLVAAHRPDLVSGLVLVGPFVRKPGTSGLMRLIARAAMAPPWAAVSWNSYLPSCMPAESRATWIADQVNGTVLMVPEAGHYPQAQRPDLVGPAIEAFAHEVHGHA